MTPDPSAPRICAVVSRDLMAGSRMRSAVATAGWEPRLLRAIDDLDGLACRAIVMDLDGVRQTAADVVRAIELQPGVPLAILGPHEDKELLSAARAAGADAVWPRSSGAQQLVAWLERLPESQPTAASDEPTQHG